MLTTAGARGCLGFNMISVSDQTNFCTCFSVFFFFFKHYFAFSVVDYQKVFYVVKSLTSVSCLSVFNLSFQSFSPRVPVVNLGQYPIWPVPNSNSS